ncbi:unnamed protein product [Schistosoma spindalis]|nr:unnamed protein product [Schistosoma spindale]
MKISLTSILNFFFFFFRFFFFSFIHSFRMYLEYFPIEWIISNIIWFMIILLNHLQYYYNYFIYIQLISFVIANHLLYNDNPNYIDDPIIDPDHINYNTLTITYYNLTYTIPENQSINYYIGQINIDLLKSININKSSKFYQLLYNSSNKINIFYQLQKSSNYILLNETTSILVTKNFIDLETLCPIYCYDNKYYAELIIYVNIWYFNITINNYHIISIITIKLIIIDIDDHLPIFPLNIIRPYRIQLKEVIYGLGKSIELPKAIDLDINPNYSKIIYRIDTLLPNDRLLIFNTFHLMIDNNNSRLLLLFKYDLDYEYINQYKFYLICSSFNIIEFNYTIKSNIEDYLEIIIDVININDIEPIFSQTIYELEIMENSQVNTVIYQLVATDKDINSTITYSMETNIDLNNTSTFLIESNGQVIIKEKLDYEQCNLYNLIVRASDGEFYAFTQLLIKIIDVNDELPEFLLNPLQLIIKENQPAKTLIGHLLIIDRDSPKVNGQVYCEEPSHLIRNQPILFVQESLYLNERTLSPKEFHHYNNNNNYSTIFSTLSSSSSSSLSSSNSETHVYQRFTLYSQNKYDRENFTDKYLAILYCWDGITTSFSNSLLSGEYDNKHGSMFSASSSDSLTATMTIVLHILDVNDNEPIFDKQLYKATLKENSPINTKIIKMHATDKDVGENAQIYYSIQKNELITPYFKIDPITGWIVNSAEIDREAQSTFKLTILAIDGGFQILNHQLYSLSNNNTIHHTSTTQLLIYILDENDNLPEFHGPRQFAIEENQPINTWIGDLQVIDRDEGLNGKVTFQLWLNENINSKFKHNTTQLITDNDIPFYLLNNGSLFTRKSLDRENQSHYCFEVIASDNGQDKTYSTIDTICIRVLDLNDNKPYFIEIEGEYYDLNKTSMNQSLTTINSTSMNLYNTELINKSHIISSVHLSINEKPGYCILIIKAYDIDEGNNALLHYNIKQYYTLNRTIQSMKDNPILDSFKLDPLNGRLILIKNLYQYNIGIYQFIVIVKDNGIPEQKSEKIIQLIIEDTPARGNWLISETIQQYNTSFNHFKYTILEAHKIFIVILLSGISTFIAALLISIILCMIKPCRYIQMNCSTKWHCNSICNSNNHNHNNNDVTNLYIKQFNETIFNYNNDKRRINHIETSLFNQQCEKQPPPPPQQQQQHHHHHQQQQQQSDHFNDYTSEGNVDNSFDNISLYTTYQKQDSDHDQNHNHDQDQDHSKKLFIINDCSRIDYMKNYFIPYYNFIETDTYCNHINTNNQTTCTMNINVNEQELDRNDVIQPIFVESILTPLNIIKNTFQQPEWNSLILELPQNDCQQVLINTSLDDKQLRCCLHIPQQLNYNTQPYDSSIMSIPSVSLASSNNSTVKPDLILLQCTNTLPISSTYYIQHDRSVSLNSTSVSNTAVLSDLNTTSLRDPKSMNKRNIDCSVQNIITPIANEEQRSDSGQGASDEENFNRIHLTNKTSISPSFINSTEHDQSTQVSVHSTKCLEDFLVQ